MIDGVSYAYVLLFYSLAPSSELGVSVLLLNSVFFFFLMVVVGGFCGVVCWFACSLV